MWKHYPDLLNNRKRCRLVKKQICVTRNNAQQRPYPYIPYILLVLWVMPCRTFPIQSAFFSYHFFPEKSLPWKKANDHCHWVHLDLKSALQTRTNLSQNQSINHKLLKCASSIWIWFLATQHNVTQTDSFSINSIILHFVIKPNMF